MKFRTLRLFLETCPNSTNLCKVIKEREGDFIQVNLKNQMKMIVKSR